MIRALCFAYGDHWKRAFAHARSARYWFGVVSHDCLRMMVAEDIRSMMEELHLAITDMQRSSDWIST